MRIASFVVASFGGGVNSTAMLIGMVERCERVDLILFADTGGEKPRTYEHIREFSKWLEFVGMPPITIVAETQTLEADCLKRRALPGVAYGFKSCSDHYKMRPQNRYFSTHGIIPTTKLIGFDAGEAYRAKEIVGNRYPLIEWDWGRDECIDAIKRSGQRVPDKSSCFFCPNMKKQEIFQLRLMYPDLAARAVAMEQNAELTSIKGLGRSFAWGALYAADDSQVKLLPESTVSQCDVCYDGEPA